MKCEQLTQEKIDTFKRLQKKDEIFVELMNDNDETKNELVKISSLEDLNGDWCIASEEHSIIPQIKPLN
jgi:hypothetical protein